MNAQVENDAVTSNFTAELNAMKSIGETLQSLEQSSRERVLQWAVSHFMASGINTNILNFPKTTSNSSTNIKNTEQSSDANYSDLPTFFDEASPKTNVDKALVVGYWVQECQGNADFVSQDINSELKHLGHGVGNITDAFNGLISQKLVMQIRKSGATKQARKKYKLTREGIKRVQQMLQNSNNE